MRILVVGQVYPWPASFGGRMRLASTIEALSSAGSVDVFIAARDRGSVREDPPPGLVRRSAVCDFPLFRMAAPKRLNWLVRSDLPLELAGRDLSGIRQEFASFVRGERYDAIWFSRIESHVAFGSLVEGPIVVDVDNLEDDWYEGRQAVARDDGRRRGPVGRLRLAQGRRNVSRWKTIQDEVARSAQATVVCSEADKQRLGLPNAHVVPNGYEPPLHPRGQVAVGEPPTMMFQGALWYGPNMDAARVLVQRIGPLVREQIPDAHVRLVGRMGRGTTIDGPDWVEATGWVPSIEPELERADLVTVPIRFGGGTRIKIIEAFAHRIPVVASSLGSYGLEAVNGRHLLVADTAEGFADACAELLTDEEQRKALIDEAEVLFLERYQRSVTRGSVQRAVRSVA